MTMFLKSSHIAAPPERVFSFHEAPDAIEQLTPPWEKVRVIERTGGIRVGARVVLETWIGPFRTRWVAEHTHYERGRMFHDSQLSGPFRSWEHTHTTEPDGNGGTWLTDLVEYELPFGALGALAGGWFVDRKLQRMFDYRHEVTKRVCESPPPPWPPVFH